jgi:hypothetical protein
MAADRVKQQQGLSRDPYDHDGDARQVGAVAVTPVRSAAARSSHPAPSVATFSLVIASSPFSFLRFLLGFCVYCPELDVEFGS